MKKLSILLLSAVFATLSSCQTMQGLGRDLGNAGGSLEKAAQR
ncbi:hypothetical protein N9118_02920 [Akkermansiaceae bacterium]|jgi:predicted small secreted protein|nr:hypothetical protein [Akkermansiaceae bacterium]MDB4518489.1 hypothetical protein [Akkermansiaceae bacterium]MDE0860903.1 hypothetical protein [Akkermansiaceae bacterium]|tara:strand:+ start:287 stop:415 length:129 start_codon:yes stop_codon:yes gene_type:complete